MVLGKLNMKNMNMKNKKKSKTGPLSYTLDKNELEIDQRLKYKTWNHKNPRRKHREKPFDTGLGNHLLSKTQKHRQQELE